MIVNGRVVYDVTEDLHMYRKRKENERIWDKFPRAKIVNCGPNILSFEHEVAKLSIVHTYKLKG